MNHDRQPPSRPPTTSATSSRRLTFPTAGNGFGGRWWRWRCWRFCGSPGSGGGNGARRSPPSRRSPRTFAPGNKLGEALELIAQPKPFCIWFRTPSGFTWRSVSISARRNGPPRSFCANWAGPICCPRNKRRASGDFLESCDLVKFAKYEPGENELRELARLRGEPRGGNRAAARKTKSAARRMLPPKAICRRRRLSNLKS